MRVRTVIAFLAMFTCVHRADAQDVVRFGAFYVNPSQPTAIVLNSSIDEDAVLDFRRALQTFPNASRLVLNSPGGLVANGLVIADMVYERQISTEIPTGSVCYSACAYIFFAGQSRLALGRLGVHQIFADNDLPDNRIQETVANIIEMLERFGTPSAVQVIMLRTPPNEIHVFTAAEVAALGINRSVALAATPLPPAAVTTPAPPTTPQAPTVVTAPPAATTQTPPTVPAQPPVTQTPAGPQQNVVGTFNRWVTVVAGNGATRTCFARSFATAIQGAVITTGPSMFTISNFPGRSPNEVSVIIGYELEAGAQILVTVDDTEVFRLFSDGNAGFVEGVAVEARLVEAMRRGLSMTVAARSASGTYAVSSYSLVGVSAAVDRSDAECFR